MILYENVFCSPVFFHEIGHSIYHEFPEIAEVAKREYRNDPLYEMETAGVGQSEENGASEFLANAYELLKAGNIVTGGDPSRYRSIIEHLENNGL